MLFYAHSGLRYLVLLLGAAAALYFLVGWLRRRPVNAAGGGLLRGFVVLVDVQILLGILLLMNMPFYAALTGHIVMMAAAAVAGHVVAVMHRRRDEGDRSWALLLTGVVLPLVLIVGGIMAIGRPILGSGG